MEKLCPGSFQWKNYVWVKRMSEESEGGGIYREKLPKFQYPSPPPITKDTVVPGSPIWEMLDREELLRELEKTKKELEEERYKVKILSQDKFYLQELQEREELLHKTRKELEGAMAKIYWLEEELKKYKETVSEEDLLKSQELKERIIQMVPIDEISEHESLVYHSDCRPPKEQTELEAGSKRYLSGERIIIPIIVARIESEISLPTTEKTLWLIAGRRRIEYAKYHLKQDKIPAIVLNLKNLAEAIEINYRENFDRTQMTWIEQARIVSNYRKLTGLSLKEVAEKFNLSPDYIKRLEILYNFLESNEGLTITYGGKEYRIWAGKLKESVPNIEEQQPVSYDLAWQIYCHWLKKMQEKDAKALQVLLKPKAEEIEVKKEEQQVVEKAISEEVKTKTVKEEPVEVKKEVEELTKEEKEYIDKANLDLEYFEIPLKYIKSSELKLCFNLQTGKCPFIRMIPKDAWKGIEEIKKQKEGAWSNLSTEEFIIYGATVWILQKVHEFRKMKEISMEEKKKIAKMKKVFQEKYMKVKLDE